MSTPRPGWPAPHDATDPRWAAARMMHLLPDERHLAALVPLVDDPEPRVAAPRGGRCGGQRPHRPIGAPRWSGSRTDGPAGAARQTRSRWLSES